MLPLWWPRTACVYCGRRLGGSRWRFGRRMLLTCPEHDLLATIDPLFYAAPFVLVDLHGRPLSTHASLAAALCAGENIAGYVVAP